MSKRARRSGGVFVGDPAAESGVATLREALSLAPAARVELIAAQEFDVPAGIDVERLDERGGAAFGGEIADEDAARTGGLTLHWDASAGCGTG